MQVSLTCVTPEGEQITIISYNNNNANQKLFFKIGTFLELKGTQLH
jgi:hypothetical protein